MEVCFMLLFLTQVLGLTCFLLWGGGGGDGGGTVSGRCDDDDEIR
jgi:hypothetical protein